jgi:hypothetical protein
MDETSSGEDWVSAPDAVEDALDEFGSEGCTLLVLESEGGEAVRTGCNRMLGENHADRRRLFVETPAASSSRLSAAGREDRRTERVVHFDTTSRTTDAGSAAAAAGSGPRPTGTGHTVATDTDDLLADTEAAIDALAPRDGFDPGQLRVCVDGVADMLEATDARTVVEYVADLRDLAVGHDGIVHLHVTQRTPGPAAEALFQQSDAVVEVADNDAPRQRWHFPDETASTEWLELES